jgi:ribosomal protein S3AE
LFYYTSNFFELQAFKVQKDTWLHSQWYSVAAGKSFGLPAAFHDALVRVTAQIARSTRIPK